MTTIARYDDTLHRSQVIALAEQTLVGTVLAGHAERALVAMGCLKSNLQIIADNERVVASTACSAMKLSHA